MYVINIVDSNKKSLNGVFVRVPSIFKHGMISSFGAKILTFVTNFEFKEGSLPMRGHTSSSFAHIDGAAYPEPNIYLHYIPISPAFDTYLFQ